MFFDLHPDPVKDFLDALLTLMAGEQWYTDAQGTGLFPRRGTVSLLWGCVGRGKILLENGLCYTPGHAGHAEELGFYNEYFLGLGMMWFFPPSPSISSSSFFLPLKVALVFSKGCQFHMLLRSLDSPVRQPELGAQSSSDQEDSCGSEGMRGMKLAQTLACTKP